MTLKSNAGLMVSGRKTIIPLKTQNLVRFLSNHPEAHARGITCCYYYNSNKYDVNRRNLF